MLRTLLVICALISCTAAIAATDDEQADHLLKKISGHANSQPSAAKQLSACQDDFQRCFPDEHSHFFTDPWDKSDSGGFTWCNYICGGNYQKIKPTVAGWLKGKRLNHSSFCDADQDQPAEQSGGSGQTGGDRAN